MTSDNDTWETAARRAAAAFSYPQTPDLAGSVRRRLASPPRRPPGRLALAGALVLLLAGLLAAPPVRAALVGIFRAGAITLLIGEPTPAPDAPLPLLAERLALIAQQVTPTQAQAALGAPPRLPAALGAPDEMWLHDGAWDTAVISLWRAADRPDAIAYSLYQIAAARFASKGATLLVETTVNGEPAFWVDGPHYFRLADSALEPWLLVEGSVLIWSADDATFRLEGAGTLAEAVRIAESVGK